MDCTELQTRNQLLHVEIAQCSQESHRGRHLVGQSHGEVRHDGWHEVQTQEDNMAVPAVRVCIAAVSDASRGNESEYLCDWGEVEVFRSQGAKALFICDEGLLRQDQCSVHLVGKSSVVQKRKAKSSAKSETYSLVDVVEASDKLRAGLADLYGALDISIVR